MPKFNVMITRTKTIESTVELEITAKDEEGARNKAEEKIDKAIKADKLEDLSWEESSNEDSFDYETTED